LAKVGHANKIKNLGQVLAISRIFILTEDLGSGQSGMGTGGQGDAEITYYPFPIPYYPLPPQIGFHSD